MGAPKGSKNALGNKGGGRKSAYQERADADLLEKMFMGLLDREDVEQKIKSGKYSLKDIFVSKAFQGNERILLAMFAKLFPDRIANADGSNLVDISKDRVDPNIVKIYGRNKSGQDPEAQQNEPAGQEDSN